MHVGGRMTKSRFCISTNRSWSARPCQAWSCWGMDGDCTGLLIRKRRWTLLGSYHSWFQIDSLIDSGLTSYIYWFHKYSGWLVSITHSVRARKPISWAAHMTRRRYTAIERSNSYNLRNPSISFLEDAFGALKCCLYQSTTAFILELCTRKWVCVDVGLFSFPVASQLLIEWCWPCWRIESTGCELYYIKKCLKLLYKNTQKHTGRKEPESKSRSQ